ncbi:MAG: ABC transporter transmembrane domain-containing protein [Acidobacteriota bacterium]
MKTLLRLLRYVRPHAGWAAVAVLGMVGVAISVVFLVFLITPIIDEVLGAQAGSVIAAPQAAVAPAKPGKLPDVGLVKELRSSFDAATRQLGEHLPSSRAVILVLGFFTVFMKNLLTYFGHYAFFRTGLATVKDLRDELMDVLLAQSARFYQRQPTAMLMSRATNDVEQITSAISDRLSDLFQDSFTVIALLIYVFSLNFSLALGAIVIAPALVFPIIHFSRKLRRRSWQSQERLGEMNAVLDEVLKGYKVVQAFCMEAFEAGRFRESTRRHFRANLKARKVQALTTPVMEVVGTIGIIALIGYASRLIELGSMTTGTFSSFLFGLYSLYTPIKRLNKVNLSLQSAIASGERVFAVIDAPVEIVSCGGARPLPSVGSGIRFAGVSFAYEPKKSVLREVSFAIPAGQVVAVVGPSGAGKSTLAQLLPRFWDVEEGQITIDGVDLRALDLRALRASLGLVTQETVLFNTTVRANIAYGQTQPNEERVRSSARAAFADEFIREMPAGYDTVIGEAGVRLSGGQRQRLAVARALYKDPPILILDEATSALDAEAEAIVQKALETLMRGRTTMVIAHRLATVRNADHTVVMEEGRVVEEGSHAELLARPGLYARLADLQGIRR